MSDAEDQVPEGSFDFTQSEKAPSIMMSPVQEQKTGSKSLKLHFSEMNSTAVANSSMEVKNKTSNLTTNLTQVSKNDTKVLSKTTNTSTNATF